MKEPEFDELVRAGLQQLAERLEQDLPLTAGRLLDWACGLARSDDPADYFLHPVAFPLMRLPWWLERRLHGTHDPAFQLDLICSNACLYYSIRLVDNVMDGHATVEPGLLPTAGYFVERFHSLYHPYFDQQHPFWEYFSRTWSEFCDVTAADGQLEDVDEQTFTALVGRKVAAAKISVAAVCHRCRRPELIPAWDEWIDLFGCWHLFREDLFDWRQDLELGAATYFLSEARRRKQPTEPEASWIAREGLDWALRQLDGWMKRLRRMIFVPPEVSAYLDFREQEVRRRELILRPALAKASAGGRHG